MTTNLDDVRVFAAVARAGGFREASRASGTSASSASEAVRRLESALGVRLLHRTTRSVAPTEQGTRLLERVAPAIGEIESALDVVKSSDDSPAGTLRLNVPTIAAQVSLPRILPAFLEAYPQIRIELTVEDSLVDFLAADCDAGIRYERSLAKDVIAIPIGPAKQRFAAGASSDYLGQRGHPTHPRDLLSHACLRVRFSHGALVPWEFRRHDETFKTDPTGPLSANLGSGTSLLIQAALAGNGVIYTYEDLLKRHFESGELVPLMKSWWLSFPGPYLYYSSRQHVPPALRAFVDFVKLASRAK